VDEMTTARWLSFIGILAAGVLAGVLVLIFVDPDALLLLGAVLLVGLYAVGVGFLAVSGGHPIRWWREHEDEKYLERRQREDSEARVADYRAHPEKYNRFTAPE